MKKVWKRTWKLKIITAGFVILALSGASVNFSSQNLPMVRAAGEKQEYKISHKSKNKVRVLYSDFSKKYSHSVIGKPRSYGIDYKTVKSYIKAPASKTVSHIKTMAGKTVKKIVFKNTMCGLLVEPSDTGKFELDYTGVEDKKMFSVGTKMENGTLTVTVKGKISSNICFIDTNPKHLVNAVRVKIPVKNYKSIKITGDCGNTLIRNIDAPISGQVLTGGVKISKKTLKENMDLKCTSGDIVLVSNRLSSNYKLQADLGDASVYSKKVTGTGNFLCKNGDVSLDAKEVCNDTQMSCTNGDVDIKVNKVNGKMNLSCGNGDISARIGTILKNMTVKIDNGDGVIKFKKKPVNLTYKGPNSGNEEDWRDVTLPKGWKNGWRTGTGKPVLTVTLGAGDLHISY